MQWHRWSILITHVKRANGCRTNLADEKSWCHWFPEKLNIMVGEDFTGVLTIAEESTAWPMVSRPVYLGGLGFSMKWNMAGWTTPCLHWKRPVHRRYYHDNAHFWRRLYAYSENFVLPVFSWWKSTRQTCLLDKMPGDTWHKIWQIARLLWLIKWRLQGQKTQFMGKEFTRANMNNWG